MTWEEIFELLKTLSKSDLQNKAKMLVGDEFWDVDLAQSAKSGEVYIIPLLIPDDGEESEPSGE